jgi:hypothetical protein
MTSNEILRCSVLIEKNLGVLEQARQLVESVPARERIPEGYDFVMELGVSSCEQALSLYFAFRGETNVFRDYVSRQMENLSTYDMLNRKINFDDAPDPAYWNEKSDRLIKETNASLGLLCQQLYLDTPGRMPSRRPNMVFLEDWEWDDRRIAAEALNIARAAQSIFQREQ